MRNLAENVSFPREKGEEPVSELSVETTHLPVSTYLCSLESNGALFRETPIGRVDLSERTKHTQIFGSSIFKYYREDR